ncbi:hypothetical protein NLI96_g4895 [Meripilus lineatus]|uniref:Uncharacterized protein n=1 Tax=Meripilus lineatus TaxID=2056292 RepID=A0AAD5V9B2_9APHY|nr:hypothetical protein NLI96_g4895 [Physisporinus lineatus]
MNPFYSKAAKAEGTTPQAEPLPLPKFDKNKRIPILGFDIVETISKFMDDSNDVSTFMKASRLFHLIGTPILLRWRVSLKTHRQLRSFHTFVFSPLQERGRPFLFLKKLHINISDLTVGTARLLSSVLAQATHVQELIFVHFDAFLRLDPRGAIPAMLALVNLEALSIHRLDERCTQFLRTANYPLTVLHVSMSDNHAPHALTDVLQFAPTLTSWELTRGTSRFVHTDVIFPHLHTLRLNFFNDYISCDKIFRPFPNLKVLVLPRFDEHQFEEMKEGHYGCMKSLARLDRPVPHLKSLSGDPKIIYHSALYCPAEELVLDVVCEERCRVIPLMIRVSHPSVIRMDVDVPNHPLEYLGPLFLQMNNLTTLKELQLRMLFYDEWNEEDHEVISAFPASLRPLQIEYLAVQFQFRSCRNESTEEWDEFEEVFDMKEWVTDIAKEVSTLRQVVLYSTWWRWIFHIDENREVVEGKEDLVMKWPFSLV